MLDLANPENFDTLEKYQSVVQQLIELREKGDGKAAFDLITIGSSGFVHFPEGAIPYTEEEEIEAFILAYNLLLKDAENGNGEAMYYISMYYQCGFPPVQFDLEQFEFWTSKSYDAGFIFAGNNLYPMCTDPASNLYDMERAEAIWAAMQEANACFILGRGYEDASRQERFNIQIGFNPTWGEASLYSAEKIDTIVSELRKRQNEGDGKAAFQLATVFSVDNLYEPAGITKYTPEEESAAFAHALELLLAEAESGDTKSMFLVAILYQFSYLGVDRDYAKFEFWIEKAYEEGYIFAGNYLFPICMDSESNLYDEARATRIREVLIENECCVVKQNQPNYR